MSKKTGKLLSSLQACRTHAILTEQQAVEIFRFKLTNESALSRTQEQVKAKVLSRRYGVSDKTIRDIWKGRTWFRETMHLDPARAGMAVRLRPPGRPKGSKGKDQPPPPTSPPHHSYASRTPPGSPSPPAPAVAAVAAAARLLVSDAGAYINGQMIGVNGGGAT